MDMYLINMWNLKEHYADTMVVVAANRLCAMEEGLHRLDGEWDDPSAWTLSQPTKID